MYGHVLFSVNEMSQLMHGQGTTFENKKMIVCLLQGRGSNVRGIEYYSTRGRVKSLSL
jgi:hypothetical protein